MKFRFQFGKTIPLASIDAVARTSLPIDDEQKIITDLSEYFIEKEEKLGQILKRESSLARKLRSQERMYNRQLSNLQKEIIIRLGPTAKENFTFVPKASDSVKSEKDRPITDLEIDLIKSRYAHHFVAASQSSIQKIPTETKTKMERRLINIQVKRARYQLRVTRTKKEIGRLAHYLNSTAWKYDEKSVILLAIPHWLSK